MHNLHMHYANALTHYLWSGRVRDVSDNTAATARSYRLCYWMLCYGRTATSRYDPNL